MANDLYLASVEDLETTDNILALQVMNEFPRKVPNLEVDLLSLGLSTQFESHYADT